MRSSTISFLIVLLFAGTTGFAQIEKHSFGAGLSNGVLYFPNYEKSNYTLGLQGSHLNYTKNWLAWKTNLDIGGSSALTNSNRNTTIRNHEFWIDLGFGPMFTYQKKDFGFYLGGTIDVYFSARHTTISTPSESASNFGFLSFPLPLYTTHLGYWQRIGNLNSPWFLEILLMRRSLNPRILNLLNYNHKMVFHNLTVGFRYEIRN